MEKSTAVKYKTSRVSSVIIIIVIIIMKILSGAVEYSVNGLHKNNSDVVN